MKKLLGCFLCVMLLTFGTQAHALLMIYPSSTYSHSGPENDQNAIDAEILQYIGISVELYKAEVGQGDSGLLANSYSTSFNNTPSDPSDATITYGSGDFVGQPAYLLVKDGKHNPGWYLFDLTGPPPSADPPLYWNGTETIQLSGFWPDQGAISHVSLYGARSVPEPATMLLFGTGILFVGVFGRKRFKQ